MIREVEEVVDQDGQDVEDMSKEGGGYTSMITQIDEKCPSDPVFCVFECLFSALLNECLLSFDVIMINNELFPLVSSHHCFRRLISLFSLAWQIRASVGSTYSLLHDIIFSPSQLFLDPNKLCRNYLEAGSKCPKNPKLSSRAKNGCT